MRRSLLALALGLLAGCGHAPGPAAAAKPDWKYSDLTAAIAAYVAAHPTEGTAIPRRVRSIYVTGEDTLSVYASDLNGAACELKLSRPADGPWAVVGTRFFHY